MTEEYVIRADAIRELCHHYKLTYKEADERFGDRLEHIRCNVVTRESLDALLYERHAGDFDHPDRLNDDGTVTFRMVPSTFRAYNISPDTYHLFNGDYWTEQFIDQVNEEGLSILGDEYKPLDTLNDYGCFLNYGHFNWEYDHAAVVKTLSEWLAAWIEAELEGYGLGVVSVRLVNSWSPTFYNFESDGFEVEVTLDPKRLRDLTTDFSVEDWAREHYSSIDGFASWVPRRIEDEDWRAEYDAGFRIEYLLHKEDPYSNERWREYIWENEYMAWDDHTTVTPNVAEIRKDFGYGNTGLLEWEIVEWAREYMKEYQAGMEPLPGLDK